MSLSSSEDSSMGSEDLDRLVAELAGGAGRRVDAAAPDEYDDDDAAGGVAGQLEEEGGDDEEESDNGDSLENLPAKFSKMAAGYRRQSTSSIASEDSRLMAALLMKTKNAQFSPEKPEPAKAPADTRRTLGSPRMFDSESSQSSDEEAGDDEVRRPYAKPSIAPPSTLKSLSVNMSDSLGLRASPVTTRFPASSPLASAKRPAVSSRDRAPATQPPPDQNPTQEPVLDRYEEDEGDQPYGVDASLLSAVNRGLTGRGHSEISLRDPTSVLETFLDVLQDLDERGTALQKAMLSGVQSRPDASDEAKNAIALLHRKLAAAEARTSMVSEDLEVVKKKAAEEKKSLQAANANLVSQLKHSENRVRAKEVTNQKLMHRLQGDVSRERERTHRNQKLKVVDPATVQSLTEEVDDLRAEISALAERLRERENYILRLEGASVAASSRGLGEHEAHRHGRLSELQAALEERDRNIVALRKIQGQLHRRIAAAEAALAERDAEREDSTSKIEQLEEELKLRPSTRAWREQQFRIEELEQSLATAVTKAKEAYNVQKLRKYTDTKELMRRDRESSRLGLEIIDALPMDTLREVAKEACRELGLSDISQVGPGIAKLTKVVMAVPRLSSFAEAICECLYEDAGDEAGVELPPPEERTLEGAAMVVQALVELRGSLLQELARRPTRQGRGAESDAGLRRQVRELVDAERHQ